MNVKKIVGYVLLAVAVAIPVVLILVSSSNAGILIPTTEEKAEMQRKIESGEVYIITYELGKKYTPEEEAALRSEWEELRIKAEAKLDHIDDQE